MSFFRNIRSSITRGKSSSRDSTPVKTSSVSSSRPSSVVSERRRSSIDSHPDSILNRGETFILGSDQEDKSHSNSSTLEKKSKKSKVLSKFNTFTKRKKTPKPEVATYEHHPSDNATNTYYKWSSDGSTANADYDAQSDPFNFLYEQHSNLKLLQNGLEATADSRGAMKNHGLFDSSTYRKGKATSQLKAQLEQLKTQQDDLCEEDQEPDPDKYKTVTLSSFRKSFRDKYLQQQKDAAHNPSWFIEVDAPAKSGNAQDMHDAKENRPDYLVFENDNYRPGSRSPVRDRSTGDGRQSRSTTRSPVKRNETFRVERPTIDSTTPKLEHNPSIRVEIKNSVMPHVPGRMVPVGVAKPMPSSQPNSYFRAQATLSTNNAPYTSTPTTAARLKTVSPQRSPYKSTPISTSTPTTTTTTPTNQSTRAGRYQTLIQISNNDNSAATKLAASPPLNRRSRTISTRIQLGAPNQQPMPLKFNSAIGSHYSYAAPIQLTTPASLSTYELLRNPSTKPQRMRHTYFGGDVNANSAQTALSALSPPTRPLMSPMANNTTTNRLITPVTARMISSYQTGYENSRATNSASKFQQQSPKRMPSTTTIGVNGTTVPTGYMNRRDQLQPRHIVPMQRRSRSPIKIPWR